MERSKHPTIARLNTESTVLMGLLALYLIGVIGLFITGVLGELR